MIRIKRLSGKDIFWATILVPYLLYNLLSITIGYWESVEPISQLPNKIAYTKESIYHESKLTNKRYDLFISSLDGAKIKNVTQSVFPEELNIGFTNFSWSPDGRFLSFICVKLIREGKDIHQLVSLSISDQNGENYRELDHWESVGFNSTTPFSPYWSNNSDKIYYIYNTSQSLGNSIIVHSVAYLDSPGKVDRISPNQMEPKKQNFVVPGNPDAPDHIHQLRLFLRLMEPSEALGPIDLFGPRTQIGLPFALFFRTIYPKAISNVEWLPNNTNNKYFIANIRDNNVIKIGVFDIRGNLVKLLGYEYAVQIFQ